MLLPGELLDDCLSTVQSLKNIKRRVATPQKFFRLTDSVLLPSDEVVFIVFKKKVHINVVFTAFPVEIF